MKGVLRIITLFGIPVQLHWSFGFIIFWILYVGYSSGMDLQSMLWFSLFIMALFICVILHEFGHALSARRYGVNTRDITLLPIGGVARLERLPEKPIQEFVVAIAGPLVNVVIALVLGVGLWLFFSTDGILAVIREMNEQNAFNGFPNFVIMLIGLNTVLVGFNLLPAFPMDGGRIFRSLLSIRLGRVRATQIASYIGQALAIGFLSWGVYNGEFILGLIGIFVFFTARQEFRMVRMEQLLNDKTAADIMRRQFTRLTIMDKMATAASTLQMGLERNLLVFDFEEKPIGVLHEAFILEAVKKKDTEALVTQYLSPRFESISPSNTLNEVMYKMQTKGYSILPVYDEESELVGIIDMDILNNYLKFQQKIR
ncbi:MAG: site-2 protease family protein [Bacteroidota bacterium]